MWRVLKQLEIEPFARLSGDLQSRFRRKQWMPKYSELLDSLKFSVFRWSQRNRYCSWTRTSSLLSIVWCWMTFGSLNFGFSWKCGEVKISRNSLRTKICRLTALMFDLISLILFRELQGQKTIQPWWETNQAFIQMFCFILKYFRKQ